ncbi:urease accessory protein UreD [Actinomycetospora chiangmaiensis]|uniref:urease accessory protein UreD n=1 Tax=Actinomycetospora chiangmaiensis TaxID=402650 RepID=UPI00036F641D|nr:urease accessory protein UreD [Actinomycetospora chiangmaiensis]
MTGAVLAAARVSLVDGRLTWTSAPPVVLRRTGPSRVHVVAVGGGPLGGDRLRLEIDLGPGEHLAVHSAAATVVQPGREPGTEASFDVEARLAEQADLVWVPEPTVVCDGAVWAPSVRIDAAARATARVVEQVVLGRAGQRGGRCSSSVHASVEGRCLLAATTVLDGTDPALTGIGGTGGARSAGTVVRVGAGDEGEDGGTDDDVFWARSPLEGPGSILSAVGTVRGVARVLAAETVPRVAVSAG